MTEDQDMNNPAPGCELLPCPFCGEALTIRAGVNGYGRCDTEGCWMHERMLMVPLGSSQVEEWNTRQQSHAGDERADFRNLLHESLYHLRLDDAAHAFHNKVEAALRPTPADTAVPPATDIQRSDEVLFREAAENWKDLRAPKPERDDAT